MDTVFDGKVGVFRCPNCQEFINTSLTECSFCHSPVDAAAAGGFTKQSRQRL